MGKIDFILYLALVSTASLSYFVSPWFFVAFVYVLIHVFFGPLDWYLLFKLYLWLKRDNEVWKD